MEGVLFLIFDVGMEEDGCYGWIVYGLDFPFMDMFGWSAEYERRGIDEWSVPSSLKTALPLHLSA